VASSVLLGVGVSSIAWLVALPGPIVGVGTVEKEKGVPVAVGVKVGKEVEVRAGSAVDTPAVRPKLVKRQACKKASRPMKPAPRINCLLSILLYRVASSQKTVVRNFSDDWLLATDD
jgi:hypothetical protein